MFGINELQVITSTNPIIHRRANLDMESWVRISAFVELCLHSGA